MQAIYQSQDGNTKRIINSFIIARAPDGTIRRKTDVLLDTWEVITDEKDLQTLRSVFDNRDTLARTQHKPVKYKYKDRIIDPRAFQLSDGSGWTADACVAEDSGAETLDTHLIVPGSFATKEEALAAAVNAGKRKVDRDTGPSEIQAVIESETRLPSTYRHGLGHGSDDVGTTAGGETASVWGPDNPEDRYSE